MPVKKKVLIVDDEGAILKILGIKLKLSGFDTISTLSGKEALNLVVSESPDIMVLDIILPDLDGFEVLKKLRAFSSIPVIAFSARPENAQRSLSLGANEFIAKPFRVDDLVRGIQKLLNYHN